MNESLTELPARLKNESVHVDSIDWGEMNVAHVRLAAGVDTRPLFVGLQNDLCQAAHWGYVVRGSIHVRYADGHEEVCHAGDVYHWPAGHAVWVDEDYEAIEFSPAKEMAVTIEHIDRKSRGDDVTDEPRANP